MFEPSESPRVFGVPPGADFARALVVGLRHRMQGQPPEAMARVQIYLNTRRMQRRVQDIFAEEGALLLPRLHLVTDLAQDMPLPGLPTPVPALRRRLELVQLVSELLAQAPDLAPRAAIYDLADSLAGLMEEMQGEGVGPEAFDRLDLAEHARHWDRALRFLRIVTRFLDEDAPPDAEALRRRVAKRLTDRWLGTPPDHPVLVAGSTGSRGTTALFMRAVASLPQGALVLPGFDFDLPAPVWAGLQDATTGEDHPQYRFRRLMENIGFSAETVKNWTTEAAPDPARNRLISLSLRPAPVTDQWMSEGRALHGLEAACAGMTLIEAPGPRAEALSIALCLREAAEQGRRACLISPDRILTRQVTAALGRWAILPDDSAGRPLGLSPPGRLLRHVAALFGRRLTAEQLLILLKHPLTHSGGARGAHLLHTRELELHLRRHGPVFPRPEDLQTWAAKHETARPWADWLGALLEGCDTVGPRQLEEHIAEHRRIAETLAQGPEGEGAGTLWDQEAGTAARETLDELAREATFAGTLSPADYANLFASVLSRRDVREAVEAHPLISIHGPREARELGADLVILGGLNDGTWPALPTPDPWLNRQMRLDSSLLLPERQVGLSAHDYQIAVAAPQIVLTRALRDAEAQTVPSRWVNRLMNLLGGLDGGPEALAQMRRRGARWPALAAAIEAPAAQIPPATRPAPRPPVSARPPELPVTRIQALIRDPYAVYARYILRLHPLDPLRAGPDPRLRGSVLHLIFERFRALQPGEPLAEARARLLAITEAVLLDEIPWPAARRLWRARLDRVADWFLMREMGREGSPVLIEKKGSVTLKNSPFRLTARPDRIDSLPDGRLHLLDYKTGTPPTPKQQQSFDKQLLLEAAMAERGGFADLGPAEVALITYIGLGSTPKEVQTAITPELTEEVWQGLERLIARYQRRDTGYAARRAMFKDDFAGDYDHLARFGEWDLSDRAVPEDVGEGGA